MTSTETDLSPDQQQRALGRAKADMGPQFRRRCLAAIRIIDEGKAAMVMAGALPSQLLGVRKALSILYVKDRPK